MREREQSSSLGGQREQERRAAGVPAASAAADTAAGCTANLLADRLDASSHLDAFTSWLTARLARVCVPLLLLLPLLLVQH